MKKVLSTLLLACCAVPMMAQWQMQPMIVVMPDGIKKNVRQLVFTQGDPEDIAYQNGLATLKLFDAEGIKYEYFTAPGGHTWYTWRNNLHQLAQRLFK